MLEKNGVGGEDVMVLVVECDVVMVSWCQTSFPDYSEPNPKLPDQTNRKQKSWLKMAELSQSNSNVVNV